jgi:hypothetical protein
MLRMHLACQDSVDVLLPFPDAGITIIFDEGKMLRIQQLAVSVMCHCLWLQSSKAGRLDGFGSRLCMYLSGRADC